MTNFHMIGKQNTKQYNTNKPKKILIILIAKISLMNLEIQIIY